MACLPMQHEGALMLKDGGRTLLDESL